MDQYLRKKHEKLAAPRTFAPDDANLVALAELREWVDLFRSPGGKAAARQTTEPRQDV